MARRCPPVYRAAGSGGPEVRIVDGVMPGTTSIAGRMSTSTVSDARAAQRLGVGAGPRLGRGGRGGLHVTLAPSPSRSGHQSRRYCSRSHSVTIVLYVSHSPRLCSTKVRWNAAPSTSRASSSRSSASTASPRVRGSRCQRGAPLRVLHDLVGVRVDRVAGVELLADALEPRRQRQRGDEVDVGAGIGGAQLERPPVDRQPAHERAVVLAVGRVHRRPGDLAHEAVGQQALVRVDRGAGERGDRVGVAQHARGELVGEVGVAGIAGAGAAVAAREGVVAELVREAHVEVAGRGEAVHERLRHERGEAAQRAGHVLGHEPEDQHPVGHAQRVGVAEVELVLPVAALVVERVHVPAQRVHVRHHRRQERVGEDGRLEVVAARRQVVRVLGHERGDAAVVALPQHVDLGLDAHVERVAQLLRGLDLAPQHGARVVRVGLRRAGRGRPAPARSARSHGSTVTSVTSGIAAHSSSCGPRSPIPSSAPTVYSSEPAQRGLEVVDRHALRLRHAVDVDVGAEEVLHALALQPLLQLPGQGLGCRLRHRLSRAVASPGRACRHGTTGSVRKSRGIQLLETDFVGIVAL